MTQEAQGTPKQKVVKRTSKAIFSTLDAGVLGVIVLALLATGYRFVSISQDTTIETVVVATPVPTPDQAKLKLHQDHSRQGPVITVNPGDIGKPNPFN